MTEEESEKMQLFVNVEGILYSPRLLTEQHDLHSSSLLPLKVPLYPLLLAALKSDLLDAWFARGCLRHLKSVPLIRLYVNSLRACMPQLCIAL